MLESLAPSHRRDEVLGDLEEVHGRRVRRRGSVLAGIQTTAEAASLCALFLGHRLRRRLEEGLVAGAELRLAGRLILKAPLLSVTVIVALTTGVTLAATGFTATTAFLGAELPFEAGARVINITARDLRTGDAVPTPVELVRGWRSAATRVERIGVVANADLNLSLASGEVELVAAARLTPAAFDYVPFAPIHGRFLNQEDARAGEPRAVVLGEPLWRRRFSGDPEIVGEVLELGGEPYQIVGVIQEAGFPTRADVWVALDIDGQPGAAGVAGGSVVGLLAAGATAEQAEAELTALATGTGSLAYSGPEVRVGVRRTEDPAGGGGIGTLVVGLLLGLLLVIAGNVGNLMVARALARRDELNVRAALGADRFRLVAQLSLEALLLTAVSSAAGLALSQRILRWFAQSEEEIAPWIDLGLGLGTIAFVLVVTGAITVLAGVLPALRATRPDEGALRSSSGAIAGGAFGWFHEAMIVMQIALAIGILGASAMVNRGWARGFDLDRLGEAPSSIVLVRFALPGEGAEARQVRLALESAIRAMDGAEAVTSTDHTPGADAPMRAVIVEDPAHAQEVATRMPVAGISDEFFEVLGVTAVAGRLPTASDFGAAAVPVAIVNEPFVRDHLGGANALGRRIRLNTPDEQLPQWFQIVGVVPDLGLSGTDPARAGGVYLPLGSDSHFEMLIRASDPSPAFRQEIQTEAFRLNPNVAVEGTWILSETLRSVRRIFAGIGTTFSTLGAIVLMLSLLGIYSILAFEVTRRTREIGVRVALGADSVDVLRPVLGRVVRYVALGSAGGVVTGVALTRLVAGTILFRFPETGAGTFAILTGVVLAASMIASAAPTLRALSVQPSEALRAE